ALDRSGDLQAQRHVPLGQPAGPDRPLRAVEHPQLRPDHEQRPRAGRELPAAPARLSAIGPLGPAGCGGQPLRLLPLAGPGRSPGQERHGQPVGGRPGRPAVTGRRDRLHHRPHHSADAPDPAGHLGHHARQHLDGPRRGVPGAGGRLGDPGGRGHRAGRDQSGDATAHELGEAARPRGLQPAGLPRATVAAPASGLVTTVRTKGVLGWLVLAALMALQAGCKEQPKPQPPPPPKVTVAQPVQQTVTDSLDLTGNTQAIYTVQLVARGEGYLENVLFQDGQQVKTGQPLLVIQQNTYEDNLRQAEAAILQYRAQLQWTESQLTRYSNLI